MSVDQTLFLSLVARGIDAIYHSEEHSSETKVTFKYFQISNLPPSETIQMDPVYISTKF